MNIKIRIIRYCSGIWLALLFIITLPGVGFVYATPVILAFFLARGRSMRAQLTIAAVHISRRSYKKSPIRLDR